MLFYCYENTLRNIWIFTYRESFGNGYYEHAANDIQRLIHSTVISGSPTASPHHPKNRKKTPSTP